MAAKKTNLSDNSLIKNTSTRLRFSVYVIIANFLTGIIGMVLGADLTALGVFLSLSNAPLYVYVLGRTLRASTVPKEYYSQPHQGSGGLGQVLNENYDYFDDDYDSNYQFRTPTRDSYNIPITYAEKTDKPKTPNVVDKDLEEIG